MMHGGEVDPDATQAHLKLGKVTLELLEDGPDKPRSLCQPVGKGSHCEQATRRRAFPLLWKRNTCA